MAKRGKHKRKSRWTSEAALQALVRFGPEESGLRAARREAASAYRTTVRQADATSTGIQYAVDQARPDVQTNYDAAGLQAARAAHVADASLGAGVPDSIKAAIGAERAGFTSRLGESRAQALTELDDRKVQAVEGAGFAKSNAQRELASTLTKLFERHQDLRREKGAFTVSTAQQLKQAADQAAATLANQEANRDVTLRGQDVTARGQDLSHKDRVAAQKRKRTAAGGGALQTPDKHLQVQSSIEDIASNAQRLIAAGKKAGRPLSRRELVKLLAEGRPQQTNEKVGPNGEKIKQTVPARKPYAADLRMSAALDVALAGHLSKTTQRRLLRARFSIRDLGLPSYGQWKRKQRQQPRTARMPSAGTLNPFN